MILNGLILVAVLATGFSLMLPKLARSTGWQATITPLASIIGSGFLVLGPILDASYGIYAPLVMGTLCLGAYWFGAAIRFNIAVIERDDGRRSRLEKRLEFASAWSLAFAYFISVAYYLNLFGAFGVSLTDVSDAFHAKLLTSGVLLFVLLVGWFYGFKMLEGLEQLSVSLKLAIIAGLLLGLGVYFLGRTSDGGLVFNAPELTGWPAVTLVFGLIVTVQGFETSRYLGSEYDAATRIASMRWAQWVSTAIYMVYIGLIAYVFERGELHLSETAIIGMMQIVAPVLPVLLIAAALSAQFSAAIADTAGSGGLIMELTRNLVGQRQAYAILVSVGLVLTWTADVFEIISLASRAFALYYALQAAIATVGAWRRRRALAPFFALLAVLGMLIVLFGTPVET